jgi:hypothetical protein
VEFFHERRPSPGCEGDDAVPVNADTLRDVNARIRAATPAYRQDEMNTKIRTTAVQRFRSRAAGAGDFSSASEYISFICGTDDGSQ